MRSRIENHKKTEFLVKGSERIICKKKERRFSLIMHKTTCLYAKKLLRFFGLFLSLILFCFNFSDGMSALRASNGVFYIKSEAETASDFGSVLGLIKGRSRPDQPVPVSRSDDERLFSEEVTDPLMRLIISNGVKVYGAERAEAIPCGDAVGISIHTEGVLIVGFGDITDISGKTVCPAKKSGLRAGDIIIKAEGVRVSRAEELSLALKTSTQGAAHIEAIRNGKSISLRIELAYDASGEAHIGCWVRDSTVGIGTLSFLLPKNGYSAALGHAVLDQDTGTLLPVLDGEMVFADVIGVSKGDHGSPGELRGTFSSKNGSISSIINNCELGVFGKTNDGALDFFLMRESLPIAFPDEVHTGDAYVISQTGSGPPELYSCRIIRTVKQRKPEQKGIVVEITDKRLLDATCGIVRGMSGSPIIQNGMLVGVVTHVFINDPTKGYGAYAFWMYEKCG